MGTIHLVGAELRLDLQVIDVLRSIVMAVLRSNVCALPLQVHFGRGDIDHGDVKHCTGVWTEEREDKGSLLVAVVMSSFVPNGVSRGLALLP